MWACMTEGRPIKHSPTRADGIFSTLDMFNTCLMKFCQFVMLSNGCTPDVCASIGRQLPPARYQRLTPVFHIRLWSYEASQVLFLLPKTSKWPSIHVISILRHNWFNLVQQPAVVGERSSGEDYTFCFQHFFISLLKGMSVNYRCPLHSPSWGCFCLNPAFLPFNIINVTVL